MPYHHTRRTGGTTRGRTSRRTIRRTNRNLSRFATTSFVIESSGKPYHGKKVRHGGEFYTTQSGTMEGTSQKLTSVFSETTPRNTRRTRIGRPNGRNFRKKGSRGNRTEWEWVGGPNPQSRMMIECSDPNGGWSADCVTTTSTSPERTFAGYDCRRCDHPYIIY